MKIIVIGIFICILIVVSISLIACSSSSSDGGDEPEADPAAPTPVIVERPTPYNEPRPTAAPPPAPTPLEHPGNSKNCADFDTQKEAQAWYDRYYSDYGDIADLDRDNDGIACESLSGMAEDGSIVGKNYAK